MTEYKSSPSRLKRLFEKSREGWKAKALERQERLRGNGVKIRDLSESRDKWKEKAKELALRVKELEQRQAGEKGDKSAHPGVMAKRAQKHKIALHIAPDGC